MGLIKGTSARVVLRIAFFYLAILSVGICNVAAFSWKLSGTHVLFKCSGALEDGNRFTQFNASSRRVSFLPLFKHLSALTTTSAVLYDASLIRVNEQFFQRTKLKSVSSTKNSCPPRNPRRQSFSELHKALRRYDWLCELYNPDSAISGDSRSKQFLLELNPIEKRNYSPEVSFSEDFENNVPFSSKGGSFAKLTALDARLRHFNKNIKSEEPIFMSGLKADKLIEQGENLLEIKGNLVFNLPNILRILDYARRELKNNVKIAAFMDFLQKIVPKRWDLLMACIAIFSKWYFPSLKFGVADSDNVLNSWILDRKMDNQSFFRKHRLLFDLELWLFYVKTFPNFVGQELITVPIHWDSMQLNFLHPHLKNSVLRRKHELWNLLHTYQERVEGTSSDPFVDPVSSCITEDECEMLGSLSPGFNMLNLAWAHSVISSRSFILGEKADSITNYCLLPLIDLCNHGKDAASNVQINLLKHEQKCDEDRNGKGASVPPSCSQDASELLWDRTLLDPTHNSVAEVPNLPLDYSAIYSEGFGTLLESSKLQCGAIALTAKKKILPGEQILLDYGPINNDLLLLNYGFIIDNQPDTLNFQLTPKWINEAATAAEVAPFFPVGLVGELNPKLSVKLKDLFKMFDGWLTRRKKITGALCANNFIEGSKIENNTQEHVNEELVGFPIFSIGYHSGIDPRLLGLIRLLQIKDSSILEKIDNSEISKPSYVFSQENEVNTVRLLLAICKDLLFYFFPAKTTEEDLRALVTGKLNMHSMVRGAPNVFEVDRILQLGISSRLLKKLSVLKVIHSLEIRLGQILGKYGDQVV